MLSADAVPRVRVLLAGRTLVTLGQALVVLAALGLLWRGRHSLREGLRALLARGREATSPA
jgi:predicted tellurium resistance membrane protein TerC